jgi:restriction system protein
VPPDTPWPGPRSNAALLAVLAVLLSMIGWTTPGTELLRPLGFASGGCACLLMWWHTLHNGAAAEPWHHRRSATNAADRQTHEAPAAPAATSTPRALPEHWHAGVLRAIEWRRFEALCEALFHQDGYLCTLPPPGSDSGVDLFLHSAVDPERVSRLLQCLPWNDGPVGVAPLRSLCGAMADAGVDSGLFVTAAAFAPEARAFAQRNRITAIDGADLLLMLVNRTELQQRQLLAVATQGEYWRPTCARCGQKMHERSTGPRGTWDCSAACLLQLRWPGEAA